MKIAFQIFLSILFIQLLGVQGTAQSKTVTDTLNVEGVCNMCKERIQKAAYVKGVKWAEWDKSTQELVVIFRTKHADLNRIAKAIAQAGHDNSIFKASAEAYTNLPECCGYRDGVHVH